MGYFIKTLLEYWMSHKGVLIQGAVGILSFLVMGLDVWNTGQQYLSFWWSKAAMVVFCFILGVWAIIWLISVVIWIKNLIKKWIK